MDLASLNALDSEEAATLFQQCNAATAWYKPMAAARPFADSAAIKAKAETIWVALQDEDFLQAFEAHPMIGNVDSLRKKYASTKEIASGEQAGATGADDATLTELAALNKTYFEKFGFIFIVFATGKSAAEMLDLLKARIGNTRAQEIRNAAAEQLKITQLRIDKMLQGTP